MISVYFNPECSKCKTTVCLLEEAKLQFTTINYLGSPPSREELITIIHLLKIEPAELLRKSEPVFIEHFANKKLSPEDCISAMLEFPILIERPIVVYNGKAMICRPPEKLLELLDK